MELSTTTSMIKTSARKGQVGNNRSKLPSKNATLIVVNLIVGMMITQGQPFIGATGFTIILLAQTPTEVVLFAEMAGVAMRPAEVHVHTMVVCFIGSSKLRSCKFELAK